MSNSIRLTAQKPIEHTSASKRSISKEPDSTRPMGTQLERATFAPELASLDLQQVTDNRYYFGMADLVQPNAREGAPAFFILDS